MKKLLDHLHISRTHLEAKFKRTLGRTIHDEITRVRLKRVCQLLYSGDETLATVVRKSGYLDISHLSRLFKKNFAISPGEYRKRNRVGPGTDSKRSAFNVQRSEATLSKAFRVCLSYRAERFARRSRRTPNAER